MNLYCLFMYSNLNKILFTLNAREGQDQDWGVKCQGRSRSITFFEHTPNTKVIRTPLEVYNVLWTFPKCSCNITC